MDHVQAAAILAKADRDLFSVLHGGDGQARCALEYRRDHPGCSDGDVQKAVREYRRIIGPWAGAVRSFRADRRGCSTAEVLAFVGRLSRSGV